MVDRKRRNSLLEGEKLRGAEKVRRIPIKVVPTTEIPQKPDWIRVKISASPKINAIKQKLRNHQLASVCEEASCPNLGECFSNGTATFMIMGDICTRRCPFCDVAHGKPRPLNEKEPVELATAIADMGLQYVVITSVNRDDLKNSGAGHFANCIIEIRRRSPDIQVEILVPDFRGRMEVALEILEREPPDIFNHNLESVPRLYRKVRPGADYQYSMDLLAGYKLRRPNVTTKSGLMLGLGETLAEVRQVMQDIKQHNVDMLTLGQYLQPSRDHLKVEEFVHPDQFAELREFGQSLGFAHVASAPLVRSSYHADKQAQGEMMT
ncbi:MAG: lipoyl synthase [Gammaproteobacteria bacterium]|jgi:lipoic acid synthetase|nr:lipoyl synthase [Gammaproteobacteria bacterium]MDP6094608.1 lipoyl synthase [Gammaproteobacteria bacterium]|tara:strand:+ start:117 stop:1082 length:966 start_codon:yes stop_codon:yes gene_type:complete